MLAQREVGVLVDVGILRRASLLLDMELKYPNRCDACSDVDEPKPPRFSSLRSPLLPEGSADASVLMLFIAAGKQESSASRRGTGCLGSALPVGDDRPDDDTVVDDPQSLEVRDDTNGAADDADSKRRQELDRRRMVVWWRNFMLAKLKPATVQPFDRWCGRRRARRARLAPII